MVLNSVFFELFFTMIEGIVFLLLFLAISDKRDYIINNRVKSLIFVVIFSVLSYLLSMYLPFGIHTIAHIIFISLLFSMITHTNIYASLIKVIISSMFIFIAELIAIFILVIVLGVNQSVFITDPLYRFYVGILSKGIQLFIGLYIFTKRKFSLNIGILKKENASVTLPLFELFTIMIFFVTYNGLSSQKPNAVVYNILFLIIIASLIFLNFMEIKERERMLQIKSRLESQQRYVENMESVIEIIRKEKHDFANHLNTIAGICGLRKEDALDRVDEYLKKIIGNYQPTYTFYASGSDFIDGLLAVKSNYAYQNGIYMDVDFDAPLNIANINDQDMVSIISNIIDNAFEAMGSDKRDYKKILSLLSFIEEDKLCVAISNNGPQIPDIYLPKIFTQGFTTKSSNGGRGYGLFIIKQIINDNGGEIDVNSSNISTEFLIKLKKKPA